MEAMPAYGLGCGEGLTVSTRDWAHQVVYVKFDQLCVGQSHLKRVVLKKKKKKKKRSVS